MKAAPILGSKKQSTLMMSKESRATEDIPSVVQAKHRTEKRQGVTENYKALPRKDIFRTFNVVRRKTLKYNLEEPSPTT